MMQCSKIHNNVRNRIEWIDCAKGIGAFLVILGHTYYIPSSLKSFIYSFHMPLFFILSGMTIKVSDDIPWKQIIIKYAKAYLIPYFILSGMNLILQSIWLLLVGNFTYTQIWTYIAGIIYCYADMEWMPNCSPLWFLPCIFLSKLLFLLIVRKIPDIFRIPVILLCVGISYLFYIGNIPRLPWNLATALMAVSFLWIGQQIQNEEFFESPKLLRLHIILLLIIFLLSPLLIANGQHVGMNENCYGNLILFFVSGIGYSFAVIVLSRKLSKSYFFSNFLGKNTIIVIGFNYFARHVATELHYIIPGIRNFAINSISLFCGTFFILSCIIVCQMIWFQK